MGKVTVNLAMSQEIPVLMESVNITETEVVPRLALDDTMVMEYSEHQMFNAGGDPGSLELPKPDRGRSLSNVSQDSQDSCHMSEDQATEKGNLHVKVKKREVKRSNSAVQAGMPEYKMSASPRGLALIIEIEEFSNEVQQKRIGSHVDVENLTDLFKQLDFTVRHEKNLTRLEFTQLLNEFSADEGQSSADMMILVVLSHGRDGHVIASDGSSIGTETIYEKFNNEHCPALQGKPKFFIIQACRGDEKDVPSHENSMYMGPSSRKRRVGNDRDTVPFFFGEVNKARPTWEDMVIAYSTIPGFTSLRDHEKGTWFIQALVETFMNHAHEKELIDLLRMTSDYLSRFTNDLREKQTCNVEMRHLYKRIYFNPGLNHNGKVENRQLNWSPGSMRRSRSTPPASPRRRMDPEDED